EAMAPQLEHDLPCFFNLCLLPLRDQQGQARQHGQHALVLQLRYGSKGTVELRGGNAPLPARIDTTLPVPPVHSHRIDPGDLRKVTQARVDMIETIDNLAIDVLHLDLVLWRP